jgi:hypothetical protein
MIGRSTPALPVIAAGVLVASCQPPAGGAGLPSAADVETYYESESDLRTDVSGNVATVTVAQDAQQLRRGGALWAKVGPYVFLFTQETQQLFEDYPGLAGVRVVTQVGGTEVASALLHREELTNVLWRRAQNIAGRARRDGSRQVTLLEDLVEWGEAHTQFEYNERFMRR